MTLPVITESTTATELMLELAKYGARLVDAGYNGVDGGWHIAVESRSERGWYAELVHGEGGTPTAAISDAVAKLRKAVPRKVVSL